MTHDRIYPRSKGGETTFENVCLACRSCNEFKADSTEAIDPLTGETVSLFNPPYRYGQTTLPGVLTAQRLKV
ncbi:MAG: hypothetical protein Fur006_37790 [Coleofasciculaceae cyanobacterium]